MYIRVVDVCITLTIEIFKFLLSDLHCDPVCFLRFSHLTLPPLTLVVTLNLQYSLLKKD